MLSTIEYKKYIVPVLSGFVVLLVVAAGAWWYTRPPAVVLPPTLIGTVEKVGSDSITIAPLVSGVSVTIIVKVSASTTIEKTVVDSEEVRAQKVKQYLDEKARVGTSTFVVPPEISRTVELQLAELTAGQPVSINIGDGFNSRQTPVALSILLLQSLPSVPASAQ